MPTVKRQVTVPANGTIAADLRPYDRFGGRGGACKVRSTVPVAAANVVFETIYVGSELVQDQGVVPVERAVGSGPDNFSTSSGGLGAAGDPINVNYRAVGGPFVVTMIMDIENG